MSRRPQRKAQDQRELRRRRDEKAFLFDHEVTRCLGSVNRDDWELAIAGRGGSIAKAAQDCGLNGIAKSAKALWGRSAEEALATYQRWRKKKKRR